MNLLPAVLALAGFGAWAAPPQQFAMPQQFPMPQPQPRPQQDLRQSLHQFRQDGSPAPRQLSPGERAELRRQLIEYRPPALRH